MAAETWEMVRAMADVGAGLSALPLAGLPDLAVVQVTTDVLSGRMEVRLQLAAVHDDDQVRALLAWADALPDAAANGTERADHIRLAVTGTVAGFPVSVWTHVKGEDLADTGCFLSLPTDGRPHRLPLGVLRALLRHRGVTTDA